VDPFLFSLIVGWWISHLIHEAPYSLRGEVSPRMQLKLDDARARRRSAGRPTTRRTGARDFFGALWSDAWTDADRSRQRMRDTRPVKKAEGRLWWQRAGRAVGAVGDAYRAMAEWAVNRTLPDLPGLGDPADFARAAETGAEDGAGDQTDDNAAPLPPAPDAPTASRPGTEDSSRTTRPLPTDPPPATPEPDPGRRATNGHGARSSTGRSTGDDDWAGVYASWRFPDSPWGRDDTPPPPPPPPGATPPPRRERPTAEPAAGPVQATATRLDDQAPPSPATAAGGELPALDAEVVYEARHTPFTTPRLQLEASTSEENAMSSTAEATRITIAIDFAAGMAEEARGGAVSMETFSSSLTAGEVTGRPLELAASAQEIYTQIASVFQQLEADLRRHLIIAESYAAVPEAGSKDFNTDA
jgi:hypothetical protein